jgi:hypothetical protein
MAARIFLIIPGQAAAAEWLGSFKEFPPRQKPASFNLDELMRKVTEKCWWRQVAGSVGGPRGSTLGITS